MPDAPSPATATAAVPDAAAVARTLAALARTLGETRSETDAWLVAVRAGRILLPGHTVQRTEAVDPASPGVLVAPVGAPGGEVLRAGPLDGHPTDDVTARALLEAVAALTAAALEAIAAAGLRAERRGVERDHLERVLTRLRRLRERDAPAPPPAPDAPDRPDAETLERIELLRRALATDRPTLHGQPLRLLRPDGTVGEVEAVELLLRPRDRAGRPLPPGRVLPALERDTVAGAVDRWVVGEALRWAPPGAARVALNLAGRSVADARFGRWLRQAVLDAPLPPSALRFEIAEQAAIDDLPRAATLLEELAGLGCELALDDFGAHGGAHDLLTRLPFHVVKLDGALVAGLRHGGADIALLRSILDVTAALGMRTVAEHVDGPDLLPSLAAIGVHAVQGFGIGAPGPLPEQGFRERGAGGEGDDDVTDRDAPTPIAVV